MAMSLNYRESPAFRRGEYVNEIALGKIRFDSGRFEIFDSQGFDLLASRMRHGGQLDTLMSEEAAKAILGATSAFITAMWVIWGEDKIHSWLDLFFEPKKLVRFESWKEIPQTLRAVVDMSWNVTDEDRKKIELFLKEP